MSNSNKDSKLFEKLKQFFRLNKGPAISNLGTLRLKEDYTLTDEQSQRVASGTFIHKRIQAIQEVAEIAQTHRLEENAVSSLWVDVNDLFSKNVPPEHRHLVFSLIKSIIVGQFPHLGILRKHFFNFIKNHNIADDLSYRLELLECLTDRGRDILYLEEEICPWLTNWGASELAPNGFTMEWLDISINVIKYNATYLDDDVISAVVQSSYCLCCYSHDDSVVLESLRLLDTIICYNHLPPLSLPIFISTLCHTVNTKMYCAQSWKIMQRLLGTHMGYSAIYFMCQIFEHKINFNNPGLIRGGLFYINMALWSGDPVKSIKISLLKVLPSIYNALMCDHPTIVFEVVLGMKALVTKLGDTLQNTVWNNVLLILKKSAEYIMVSSDESTVSTIADYLNEILTNIELLIESNAFNGSRDRFCDVLETFSLYRPESSIYTLMTYKKEFIVPTHHEWIANLDRFLNYYYIKENRTSIKIAVIRTMKELYNQHSTMYEDELIKAIQHAFGRIAEESNISVRKTVCLFIIEVCNDCSRSYHEELLQILETVVMRPFKLNYAVTLQEQDVVDLQLTVEGLSRLFIKFVYQYPTTSADCILVMLVTHLKYHYEQPYILEQLQSVRLVIIELLVKLRADSKYRLGVLGIKGYSPYIYVDCSFDIPPSPNSSTENIKSIESVQSNLISLTDACRTLILALDEELDWRVLNYILKEIPQILKNKALVLSKNNEVDSAYFLASTLCRLVNDKRTSLKNTPPKWLKTDFQIAVYPALAAFVSYHNSLDPSLLRKLVKCLISGLVNRCVRPVITALTTCILEMREIMIKLLPEVLLNMSKLSATTQIAVPVLEFLSMLSRLPKVYSNFVVDQYMSVFAITLPYTNPFKYNHYTVSLAHRVIAIWFLKCRTSFRRNFVEFIKKGLNQNVLAPFEGHSLSRNDILNEDSTNRKRSSSLTEQGSRRRDRSIVGGINPSRSPMNDLKPPIDNSLLTFHKELTETCMDLLARYAFATCSALPKRHPTAHFILEGGQSATWLLGTKLITISTSGCTLKPFRRGLCSKCCQTCCPVDNPLEGSKLAEKMKLSVSRSQSSETSDQHDGNASAKGVASPSCLSTATSSPEESKRFSHADSNDGFFDTIRKDSLSDRYENLQNCICWCQSWAEISIRCPTGDMSWMMRVQNDRNLQEINSADSALFDVSTLFHPSLGANSTKEDLDKMTQYLIEEKSVLEKLAANDEVLKTESVEKLQNKGSSEPIGIPGSPLKLSSSRQNSQDSCDVEDECYDIDDYENGENRSRNPVRRSNSSPEMSSGWKNPFFQKDRSTFENEGIDKNMEDISKHLEVFNTPIDGKKMKQNYPKDLRYNTKGANCEAIPEEICGTGSTPPSNTCLPKPLTLNLNLDSVEKRTDWVTYDKKNLDKERPKLVLKTPSKLNSFNESDSSTRSSAESVDLKQSIEFPLVDHYHEEKSRSLTSTPSYLTKKPPLSPPIYGSQTLEKPENDLDPPMFRGRVHTLAVMNTIKRPAGLSSNTSSLLMTNRSNQLKEQVKSGINPSFVFLQLYHSTYFGNVDNDVRPMLLPPSETSILRAVQNLDWIPPYELHKIGVIYVGLGQANSEQEILQNQHGSVRYTEFLKGLGTLIKLSETDLRSTFLGGLDKKGDDGQFSYVWRDDIMQVIFHIATLMPSTPETDPKCYNKKKNIGNDYVTIVYNESGQEYDIQTLRGQFNYGCVIVEPLEHGINQITVKVRDELREHVGHQEPKIVSDQNTAMLARQLAIHTDLASQILSSLTKKFDNGPYASNWLERLRYIKRIQAKVKALESQATGSDSIQMTVRGGGSSSGGSVAAALAGRSKVLMSDFTKYT